MPDANSQDLQAELALLREQVKSQLEAHRLEVAAAIERLSGARETPHTPGELSALRERVVEWERRETELSEQIAARNIEYQALRARTELDRYRLELQLTDLEKQLALRDAEIGKLKSLLDALMAEHAECCRKAMTPPRASTHDDEHVQRLKSELAASRLEAAQLRDSIANSVALKVARSFGWFVSPVRSLFSKRPGAGS
ncbi:MAG: hypothetical protein JWP63_1048 [Candidatus Solibacter sp.]|jgi:predicted  nucleic acid-binding Zn-ribbon protein|nr:hypothetical protein [Candidatus Solibacter sp.]